MIIKQLLDEDFVNYKKPSMFIGFPSCTFKCEKECGEHCCQNSALAQAPNKNIVVYNLCTRYLSNPITKAIVCGGLEPMDDFKELYSFIYTLRYIYQCSDDVVIYTGYTEYECIEHNWIQQLYPMKNIIVKFGRYIPNQEQHFDETLGVMLASPNQYAKVVS